MSLKAIGIDIGGTTTKAAVVDETGAVSYIKEIKTPQNNELGFFRELNNLIENALHHEPEVVAWHWCLGSVTRHYFCSFYIILVIARLILTKNKRTL